MSEMDSLLAAVKQIPKETPLSVNAGDLFMKGHITAEEYSYITKGEKIIKREPQVTAGKELGRPVYHPFTDKIPIDFYSNCLKTYQSRLEAAIKTWVPHQIDHVIIRATYDRDLQLEGMNPDMVVYLVKFKLIDVKKETSQQVATQLTLDLRHFTGEQGHDDLAWKQLTQATEQQLHMIVLQLIYSIRTGNDIA